MYNKSGNSFDAVGPVLRKRAVYKPDVQFQNTQRNQYTEGQYKKIIYDNSQIGINDTKHIQYRPRHNTGIQENVFCYVCCQFRQAAFNLLMASGLYRQQPMRECHIMAIFAPLEPSRLDCTRFVLK
jgi:hypothetical protein